MVSAAPGHPEDPLGDPESVARAICLRLLDRRARSRAELADALRRRGVPDHAAQTVLDRLTEVGLIDDAAFADALVEARHRERGLASRALVRDLQRRGIDAELARSAVASVDRDAERARASALVRARLSSMGGVAEPARSRRLIALLGRKGYDGSLAYEVVARATRELDEATGA